MRANSARMDWRRINRALRGKQALRGMQAQPSWQALQSWLAQLPLALAGLTLGLASLAQLLQQTGSAPAWCCQLLTLSAALLWTLLLLKIVMAPRQYWLQLQDPLAGSIAPTAAMALAVLSQSIGHDGLRLSLWYLAIALHLSLLLIFIRARCRHWQFSTMQPAWFVPPVGILVAVVTCPTAAQLPVASGLLWFGASCFVLLLPLMLLRLLWLPLPVKPQQTTLAVLAAPASLTLVAYLSWCQLAGQAPALLWCVVLYSLALLLDLLVWVLLIPLLKQDFHAGFAALTFPLVIGSLASFKLTGAAASQPAFAALTKLSAPLLAWQICLAVLIVGYVALRFGPLLLPAVTPASLSKPAPATAALSANIHLTER